VEECWALDPKVCVSRHSVFLSFERSMLSSCKTLSYKRKLPVGGSVKLGKVARIFTHFGMVYVISTLRPEWKLTGHTELHLQPPLYRP